MVCDDYGISSAIERAQKEYNEYKARTELSKQNCENASQAVEDSYGIFNFSRKNFDLIKNDRDSLEAEYKRLEEQMQFELKKARETAQKEGKNEAEIDKICDGIRSSFTEKMMLVQYKICQRVTPEFNKKGLQFRSDEKKYTTARFNEISATAIFLQDIHASQNANYTLGRWKQFGIFADYFKSQK